jgi:hypothetical protein
MTVLDLLAEETEHWQLNCIPRGSELRYQVSLSVPGWYHFAPDGLNLGPAQAYGWGNTPIEAHAEATRQRELMLDPSYNGTENTYYAIRRADAT